MWPSSKVGLAMTGPTGPVPLGLLYVYHWNLVKKTLTFWKLSKRPGPYAFWKTCNFWFGEFFVQILGFLKNCVFIGTWKDPWIGVCNPPSTIFMDWLFLDKILSLLSRHSELIRDTEFCSNLLLWNTSWHLVFKLLLNNYAGVFCSFPVVKEHRSVSTEGIVEESCFLCVWEGVWVLYL